MHPSSFAQRRAVRAGSLACGFVLAALLPTGDAVGYGGSTHRALTSALYEVLQVNGYGFLCQFLDHRMDWENETCWYECGKTGERTAESYMEKIVSYSTEPDDLGLTDGEVNQYGQVALRPRIQVTPLVISKPVFLVTVYNQVIWELGYSFQRDMDAIIDELIDQYFPRVNFGKQQVLLYKVIGLDHDFVREKAKEVLAEEYGALADMAIEAQIADLKRKTQHTYVYDLDDGTPFSKFRRVSIAPWAAQAEYNQALLSGGFQTGKSTGFVAPAREEALRRLGRTLHYIQDITVPHHCELPGNYADLLQGVLAGDPDAGKEGASQKAYESTHMTTATVWTPGDDDHLWSEGKLLNERPAAAGRWARWFTLDKDLFDQDIVETIREMRAIVVASEYPNAPKGKYMDFCDGVPQYKLDCWQLAYDNKGMIFSGDAEFDLFPDYSIPETWARATLFPLNFDPYHITSCPGYCRYIRGEASWPNRLCAGVNDDFDYVAEHLVPLAVRYSAMVVLKFFYDQGIIDRRGNPVSIRELSTRGEFDRSSAVVSR